MWNINTLPPSNIKFFLTFKDTVFFPYLSIHIYLYLSIYIYLYLNILLETVGKSIFMKLKYNWL